MHHFIDQPKYFTAELTKWYLLFKRKLPWRETKDPYKIWLSEIILQQTRVSQGTNYYLKFIKNYPTVQDLANASEEEVLKDWQGLGYYSRARNLHAASKFISYELNNTFPNTYNDIKKLKGIGDYTAAAIASFAFQLPHAVVDGNVYRVLSRILGIETPIDSTKGKKEFQQVANILLNEQNPGEHNQAIMEFGALQCLPKNPKCSQCPFESNCHALKNNLIDTLPVKEKKIKQKKRFLNYLIIEDGSSLLVNKRTEKGIWQNLYDFPLVETKNKISAEQLQKETHFQNIVNDIGEVVLRSYSEERKHILSHQILNARFFHFNTLKISPLKNLGYQAVLKKNLSQLPIPKLIENYLNEETNLLSLLEE